LQVLEIETPPMQFQLHCSGGYVEIAGSLLQAGMKKPFRLFSFRSKIHLPLEGAVHIFIRNCWKFKHVSGRLCVRLWEETNHFYAP
jgi:hypothetical protein